MALRWLTGEVSRFLLGANQLLGNQPRGRDKLKSSEFFCFSYGYQFVEIYFSLDYIMDASNRLGDSRP